MIRAAILCAAALAAAGCGDAPTFAHEFPDGGGDGDGDSDSCGEALLECPGTESAACAGVLTDVDLSSVTTCGEGVSVVDDRPDGGFPVGETTVTFDATDGSETASCQTVVTVTDEAPPAIECAPEETVVRAADGEVVAPPPPTSAGDLCTEAVSVTTAPEALPDGTTAVAYTATDGVGLQATCTTDVTVLPGFAATDLRVLSAGLGGDGSTVIVLGWGLSDSVDVTGYRVERATSADGPFAALGTTDAVTPVYMDSSVTDPHVYYRVVTLVGELDGGATEPLHAYAVAATSYSLDGESVPGVSFLTTLYGAVRYPVDLTAGPYPLVVMLHGNHGNCRLSGTTDDSCQTRDGEACTWSGFTTTPNAEGMAFQAETLAAQGYVAVSISANALNCRDDFIPERVQLLLEHLRRWKAWSGASGDPFGDQFVGAVDMSRVGLVGHSRGGDAVSSVPLALADTPIEGVTVASIFAIAPTDYHATTPIGTPYAVLLPSCDGDVSTLWGKDIYDRALDLDDHVPRAQVFFIGANHNFFSTEWSYDDGADACTGSALIGAPAQRRMLAATEGAWFNGTLGGGGLPPFVRADGETPTCVDSFAGADLDLRWSYAAPHRSLIDDFTGTSAPSVNLLGEANTLTGFAETGACFADGCETAFEDSLDALSLSWADGSGALASFGLGGLDASGYGTLSFRVVSRDNTWNDGRTEQAFWMRVADADGDEAALAVEDVQPIRHLYVADDVREILQTVRVPLAELVAANPDLDLDALEAFELDFSPDGASGSVLVTEVELAE